MKNTSTRRRSPRARITRHNGEDSKTSGRSRSESREKSFSGRSRSETTEKSVPGRRKRRTSFSEENAKKKRNTSPVNTFQKVGKTYINGRLVDSFCWMCHEVTNDIFCERCPRRYHEACLEKAKLDRKYCECNNVSVDGKILEVPWCPAELKQCLEFAVQEAIKDQKKKSKKSDRDENDKFMAYFKNWPTIEENESLNTIVDITVLIDKMNNEPPYLNTGSFFSDVKWIYHNCYIVYGADHDITKSAMMLERNFKQELTDCEACRECYINKHKQGTLHANYFLELCHKPHPIVWAKMRSYPFWPAKCLKIHNGHADVRFFGSHDKGNILLDQVFKYSKERPKKESTSKKFKEAVLETEYYIANYENKYGTFQYFKKKTPLDVITKKQPRKGRGRRSYETPGKRRSDGNTLEGADKNEGSSEIEKNNAVERKCFVRLDLKDIPSQDGNFDSASKKKSSEPLTTSVDKDYVDTKVAVFQQISGPIMDFSARENEDASILRSNENFVVVNSNLDHLISHEKENSASNGHVTGDHSEDPSLTALSLDNPTPASLSLDNPPNMNSFPTVSPYIRSENSDELGERNVESGSNPSSSNGCFPVIMSTFGDLDSHEPIKDFRSPTCDTLANLLSQGFSKHPLFKEKSVPEAHNSSQNENDNQQEDNDSDEEDDDDDDDCQMLPESETLHKISQMGAITKNAALCNTFVELLLTNKPRSRHLFKQFQNFASMLFIAMSLEANESNSFENIQQVYAKYLTKINSLEADKQKLIAENKELKEECGVLNERVKELDIRAPKKDLLRGIVNAAIAKQKEESRHLLEASNEQARLLGEKLVEAVAEKELLAQEYEMVLAIKNKEIEELQAKVTPVLKCDKECQADLSLSANEAREHADSQIMHELKELSESCQESFKQQEFSQIENFNEICSNTRQQHQDIAESIHLQSLSSFPHSNLQFQSHNETTSSQIFIEQLPGPSSNVLCERRNLLMSDSTTYVTQTVMPAPMVPVLLAFDPSTALSAQVNTNSEGAQNTQSSAPKRKQRQVRKPVPSTSRKTNKGNKKNG